MDGRVDEYLKCAEKEDVGTSSNKILGLAVFYLVLILIASIAGGIVFFVIGEVGAGIGVLLGGIIFSIVTFRLIRGFGELVRDTNEIKAMLQEKLNK